MAENNIFIRNLTISGYKSIKEIDIELRPINIILGANGAGKSNLVSVFDFIRHELEDKIKRFNDANSIFHFGTKKTKHIDINFEGLEYSYKAKFGTFWEKDTIICEKKSMSISKKIKEPENYYIELLKSIKPYHFHNTSPHANVRSSHGVWDNIDLHQDGANIAPILYKIKSYGQNPNKYEEEKNNFVEKLNYYNDVLHKLEQDYKNIINKLETLRHKIDNHMYWSDKDVDNKSDFIERTKLTKERFRIRNKMITVRSKIDSMVEFEQNDKMTVVDNSYNDEQRQNYISCYNDILLSIRAIAPYFDDFILEKNDNDKISLRWKNTANLDWVFDSSQLSDGTLRFILLATLLLQPNPPKVIVLDEPEIGLHPLALTVLAEIIQSVSQKTQIILTTQSVEFANFFEPEDFIVADYKNGETKLNRPNIEELEVWLDDYGMGDIWCKNIIGGRP